MSVSLPNPIHHWNFDEPGESAKDSAGGLTAVVETSGGKWSTPGKWNGAMRFSAAAARIVRLRKDGAALPDLATDWTVGVWIMRHKNPGKGAALLSGKDNAIKIEQHANTGKLGITHYGKRDLSIPVSLEIDRWTHLTVVGTSTETRFYLDGKHVHTLAWRMDLPRDYLGSRGGTTDWLEATLEELRIYDKALTPEQVAELAGLVPVGPTLPFEKLPLEPLIDALGSSVARLTAHIPWPWSISYDVNTEGTAINDGGTDMFDVGNMLASDIDTLAYTSETVRRHAAVGPRGAYFTLRLRQMFIAVADLDGVLGFGTQGGLGADGGSVDGTVLTSTIEGARYRGFVKRVYGTADPSVNHLFIVRDDARAIQHAFPADTARDEHTLSRLPAKARVYYLMFGSRHERVGVQVGFERFQAIMDTFLAILAERAKKAG